MNNFTRNKLFISTLFILSLLTLLTWMLKMLNDVKNNFQFEFVIANA